MKQVSVMFGLSLKANFRERKEINKGVTKGAFILSNVSMIEILHKKSQNKQ